MMRKVLFFDIDGTLAIHGHIPESNKKALEALKEKGYDTFICTGRALIMQRIFLENWFQVLFHVMVVISVIRVKNFMVCLLHLLK